MQKLSGNGMVFVEIDGSAVEYELAAGQQMIVDTGYLAMMDATCSMDVAAIKGAKNMIFGGEGIFNTVITGPGKIVLQTMPVNSYRGADTVRAYRQVTNILQDYGSTCRMSDLTIAGDTHIQKKYIKGDRFSKTYEDYGHLRRSYSRRHHDGEQRSVLNWKRTG